MKNLKFIHMADLHIGARAYKNLNIDAFALLYEIIQNANNDLVDIILISGDIFNEPPSNSVLSRLNSLLSEFNGSSFIIFGNHDNININSKILEYKFSKNIHIFSNENITNKFIKDKNTRIWGLSYESQQINMPLYNELLKDIKLNTNEINILLAHGGDESHIPTNFDDLSNIGFDYVAFGHLHQYQTPKFNIVYSGSLIPMDKTETYTHGYVLGNFVDSNLSYELIDLGNNYIKLDIDISDFYNLEDIYKKLYETCQNNDTYIITLTGKLFYGIDLDIAHLKNAGNILEIIDNTEVDIDYDELKKYNQKNILGIYIDTLQKDDDELSNLALKYGVIAFLEAKDNAN